jgi:hypothetical protein
MRAKWADFLFTLAVRFIGGAVLGLLPGFLILCPGRRSGSHPLIVWVAGDEAHPHRFLYWFICWAVAGGIIGMFTTPYWQTPWYKYERLQFDKKDREDDAA